MNRISFMVYFIDEKKIFNLSTLKCKVFSRIPQLFSLFKSTNQIRDFKGICNFVDYLWNISNYCFRPLLYFCMMFEHMKNEVLMKLYTSKLMKRTTVRH